jgi:hypothetical protein
MLLLLAGSAAVTDAPCTAVFAAGNGAGALVLAVFAAGEALELLLLAVSTAGSSSV